MRNSPAIHRIAGVALAMVTALTTLPAQRAAAAPVAVAAHAGVSVWISGGDVFPSYRDVTIWFRADRDCYSTLFLVDTAGYLHVLYPGAVRGETWVRGGQTYCYRAGDLGLDRLDGCGVAYLFAVGSPLPFSYADYGDGILVDGCGYRVVGDPFVASRDFYMSLLPAGCPWDYVGVGYARFYVREWVRYPSYLCIGGPGYHVQVGNACRDLEVVYASYREHVAAPYEALRPAPRFKQEYARATGRVQTTAYAGGGRASGAIDRGSWEKPATYHGSPEKVAIYRAPQTRVISTSTTATRGDSRLVEPRARAQARIVFPVAQRSRPASTVVRPAHPKGREVAAAGTMVRRSEKGATKTKIRWAE